MYSIDCEDCGEQIVAPRNRTDPRLREVVVVCVDCKTEWVFTYDDKGTCVACRRAKTVPTRPTGGLGADLAPP